MEYVFGISEVCQSEVGSVKLSPNERKEEVSLEISVFSESVGQMLMSTHKA